MLKLSFILPCYNVAPYIGRCIESIEHQDIPQSEYEVICVDDCSTDDTVQKIKEYQVKYPNIQLICHTENMNAGGARNTALDAAKGKYVWCVDPDDSIQVNVVGKLIEKAEKQGIEMLMFNLIQITEDGREHKSRIHKLHDDIMSGVEYTISQCAPRYLYDMAAHTCCLYKRVFLEENQIRYPVIRSSQDVVFVWKAVLLTKRVSAVNDCCYHVYRRPESTTGSKGRLHANAVISASLLYVHEVGKLMNLCNNAIIDNNLRKEMRMSINDDSRKVLKMSSKEQRLFYHEICKYSNVVELYRNIMDRKTKVIFNYRLPYVIWQLMIWMYLLKNNLKK